MRAAWEDGDEAGKACLPELVTGHRSILICPLSHSWPSGNGGLGCEEIPILRRGQPHCSIHRWPAHRDTVIGELDAIAADP
jgi:hypothetical protein